ncbi:hypothetical protein QEG73_12730 [Chitinophagaceae bacterium 26-R-25]|nr:hypothetical protein [Chitinophagaceae bacterium 26-R-25]
MNILQIINFFLSVSGITAGLIFIAKFAINQFGKVQILKYKQSLENDTEEFKHKLNFETEKFKQELNKATIEHQIKYTKLYEERGLIIKQTYNLLYKLENSLTNLTSMFQGSDWTKDTERDKQTNEVIAELRTQLEQNRIFFSADLCSIIENILIDAHKITIDIYSAKQDQEYNDNSNKAAQFRTTEEILQPIQTWRQLDQKAQKDIKALRLNLAQEFRILIGVE